MNKIHYIKRQKLPRKSVKQFIKQQGWRNVKQIDLENIELQFIPTAYKKTCIVLLEVNNEFWYSETFDKFIKEIGKTKAETVLDFIATDYSVTLISITLNSINSKYVISDWGKVTIIEDE